MSTFCITPDGRFINLDRVIYSYPYRENGVFYVRIFFDVLPHEITLEGQVAKYFCGLAYFRENSSASHFNSQIVINAQSDLSQEQRNLLIKAVAALEKTKSDWRVTE